MKPYRRLYLCFLFLIFLPTLTNGQTFNLKVYAPVPKYQRARLNERLKLYVEYERSWQYDKLYDLFSESYIVHLQSFSRGKKKAGYAKIMGTNLGWSLVEFKPTSTKKRADGSYIILGRAKTYNGHRYFEERASIDAYWEKGDWYFSEYAVEIGD